MAKIFHLPEISRKFLTVLGLKCTNFRLGNVRFLRTISLRDYQQDAITCVHEAISQGVKRPAVVLATGGGKTVVFSHLIPQMTSQENQGNKTLVLAHKEELVKQAADTISQINPNLKVEIDMRHLKPSFDGDVIVGSVPTLVRYQRLQKYQADDFKTIILDECHHATANSWLKVLKYFNADNADLKIYVIGFTATMERSDGAALGSMFDQIVYERDLLTMIKNRELVDIKFSSIGIDVDLSKVKIHKKDYEINSLSKAINSSDVNFVTASSYLKLKKKYNFKSTIIFCVDINHCKTLCGVLQREGINAQYVTSETSKFERKEIIKDFKEGLIEVLCNVQVFTEGTDIPNIDSLLLARPTKSRPLLVQMIGRGLRLHKDKERCHVVDIVGTRGTGMQSVPTLFSLPENYSIQGKTYEELMMEKKDYDQEIEQNKKEMQLEAEQLRRLEEQETHKKLCNFKRKVDEMNISITTIDGFSALQSKDAKVYEDNKLVQREFLICKIPWVRLEYDIWGYQVSRTDFFQIERKQKKNGELFFCFTINQFTSREQKIASSYKCGKSKVISEPSSSKYLKQVLIQAENLHRQMKHKPFSNFSNATSISSKQREYLHAKLLKKANQNYEASDDTSITIMENLNQFTKERASKLIFAFNFSPKSLWIGWELQRILGPSEIMKKKIRVLASKS
ncbi:uncharacterized protein PRCAT00001582001 [Priceomyces carsonii]|uniref:uncharacterized protein n=1 Tax=Priceomyces carsonii TaxID=28549 RepID=UPI002EDA1F5E|nr:unnamed protein product [Priceomyces carsonii]